MKAESTGYSLIRTLVMSLYIAACYWALIGGEAKIGSAAYRKLTKDSAKLDSLVARGIVNLVEVDKGQANSFTTIECGLVDISSRQSSVALVIIPGFVVFLIVFVLTQRVVNSTARGFFILLSFIIVCFVANSLQRHLLGIGWIPSTTVLLTSCFYGALFWWISNFLPREFNEILDSVGGNIEKLRMMYDHSKFCWNVIGAFFISICITLAWNITGVFRQEEYLESGLGPLLTRNTIWLVFWGSLGLLGFAGLETARRLWAVVKSIRPDTKKPEHSTSDS